MPMRMIAYDTYTALKEAGASDEKARDAAAETGQLDVSLTAATVRLNWLHVALAQVLRTRPAGGLMAAELHEDDWERVRAALANPDWDFRTVDGIARETSLPRGHVELALRRHSGSVRQTVSRDRRSRGWRVVYTLKSRPRRKVREFFADLLTVAGQ